MCSAALEAFGATWTLSDPIQHAESKEVGCWPCEPLDSLIGGVALPNRTTVWYGDGRTSYVLEIKKGTI